MQKDCLRSTTPIFWSVVSENQMKSMLFVVDVLAAFSPPQWAQIPGASVASIDGFSSVSLSPDVCGVITPEQLGNFSADFFFVGLNGLAPCVARIQPSCWARMNDKQMQILSSSGYLKELNESSIRQIPPEAISGLMGTVKHLCPYLSPEQAKQVPPASFSLGCFPECASMSDAAWKVLSAAQVSEISPSDFEYVSWNRVSLLASSSIAAVTQNQWAHIGVQIMMQPNISSIVLLSPQDLIAVVTSAKSNLLVVDPDRLPATIYATAAFISKVKGAITIVNDYFPFPANESDFAGLTWLHFAFLDHSTIPTTGMDQKDITNLRDDFSPIRGIRGRDVAALFASAFSVAALSRDQTAQILTGTFSKFSSDLVNNLRFPDAISADWNSLSSATLNGVSWAVWEKIPLAISSLNCSGVSSLNASLIYSEANACGNCTSSTAFQAAFQKCNLAWNSPSNAPSASEASNPAVGIILASLPSLVVMVGITIYGLTRPKDRQNYHEL